jgi:lysophospholipase L1-like esterase
MPRLTANGGPRAERLGRQHGLVLALLAGMAACGGNPNPLPPPPPPPPLQASCPAPITRNANSPQGADVHFDAPTASGGRAPYSIQCEPGSGSVFPIGDNLVRCTVTDADTARASCEFPITVEVGQTLGKTNFMAFGDSITDGAVSLEPMLWVVESETYPFQLGQILQGRYPSQTFTVINAGKPAERTDEGARRLPVELDLHKPEVVMILEGVNAVWLLSTSRQADAIRSMVRSAHERHVDVILATVMPVTPAWRFYDQGAMDRIRALNERIFQIALIEDTGGVVDLFALFEANPHLLGADGLHPTVEGQRRIAEAFSDEIVRRYQPMSTFTRRLNTMIGTAR